MCRLPIWGVSRLNLANKQYTLIQYNLNGSNPDCSFTVGDSNSFFQSLQNPSNSSRKQIFRDLNQCESDFVMELYVMCNQVELPYRCNSNEYTQHTIIVWKIEKISLSYRYLLPELVP